MFHSCWYVKTYNEILSTPLVKDPQYSTDVKKFTPDVFSQVGLPISSLNMSAQDTT